MTSTNPIILVTGASGQLGRLVIDALLTRNPATPLAAMVRRTDQAAELIARGVNARIANYADPATLASALAGVERLLLISSSEIGKRTAQHQNVIDAAKIAGVGLVAYTSVLHADTSPLGLADEHRQTEAALRASGLAFVLLRNGWYTENYTASIPPALAHGALFGAAGAGRISSAARADYAAAAAAVLTSAEDQAGRIYELAGDNAYTLADLAAEISRQTGRTIPYRDLPKADYEAALLQAGLPAPLADLLADSDAGAADGALFDDSRTLSRLIGRPTTPMTESVGEALAALTE